MRCSFPAQHSGFVHPCGKCFACRSNQRRTWTHRIMLESMCHGDNCFITLTYDDDHLPDELIPGDLQLFLKRLRRYYEPNRFRFFAVGEYGDRSARPHYHLALFGFPLGRKDLIDKAWQDYGFTMVGDLNFKSASYIGGYVTKKLQKKADPRLEGKKPEFNRMSLKPGIGALAMDRLLDILCSPSGRHLLSDGDVPKRLKYGKDTYPLGRYLVDYLRKSYGMSDEYIAQLKNKKKEELRLLFARFQSCADDEEKVRLFGTSDFYKIAGTDTNPNQELILEKRLNLRKRIL